jgi:long-chain acyl-CoA synthetase
MSYEVDKKNTTYIYFKTWILSGIAIFLQAMEANHLAKLFINRTHEHSNRVMYRYRQRNKTGWQSTTWHQAYESAEQISKALLANKAAKGENIGIISPNSPEWLLADFGIQMIGGVTVPMYTTSTADQLEYIINEACIRIVFSGSAEITDRLLRVRAKCPSLEHIICSEDYPSDLPQPDCTSFSNFCELGANAGNEAQLRNRIEQLATTDLATIIYTSGTTGEPKGVLLDHSTLLHALKIHDERLELTSSDRSLCFLPLCHVFERLWSYYVMHRGAENWLLDNPREIIEVLPQVKPTVMCVVPRFFEKTMEGIHAETKKWPSFKQKIFHWAVRIGLEGLEYKKKSKPLPLDLKLKNAIANKLVHSKLRKVFGGNIRFMPCAGAAISPATIKFFQAVGVFVNYGYGLTETCATVSCYKSDNYNPDTAGTPMPEVIIKISEEGEILIKSKTVFTGYYKKPEATAAVLKDGWFKTGDKGYLTFDGDLVMTDRIKDLFKTSGGLYVSPQKLELLFKTDALVEQIAFIGDNRKYITALIVPTTAVLEDLANQLQLETSPKDEFYKHPKLVDALTKRFAVLQTELQPHEQVKRFALLDEPFTIDNGQLTSTLKTKRKIIEAYYQPLIENLYTHT